MNLFGIDFARLFRGLSRLGIFGWVVVVVAIVAVVAVIIQFWPFKPKGAGEEVHGYVYADVPPEQNGTPGHIWLPDVTVYLRHTGSGRESPRVRTDLKGFFMVPRQPKGEWEICLEARGYVDACPRTVEIADRMVFPGAIGLKPGGEPVIGRVILENGRPCHFADAVLGISFRARVLVTDRSGKELLAAPVDTAGRYVVPDLPKEAAFVKARCQEVESAPQSVAGVRNGERDFVKVANSSGTTGGSLVLTLPNSPPERVIVSAKLDGKYVRRGLPGRTVKVSVSARDKNRDALHYRWSVSGAGQPFSSKDSATVDWTLPESPGQNRIYVAVLDGRGGVARGSLQLSTGEEHRLFTGKVTAGGDPVPGAQIIINGQAVGETNSRGGFAVMAPPDPAAKRKGYVPADRFVLTIRKAGYQSVSRVSAAGRHGRTYTLVKAEKFTIDSASPELMKIDPAPYLRAGAEVRIKPGSLLDASGTAISGLVDFYVSSIDLRDRVGRFPGEFVGRNRAGDEVPLTSLGALEVQPYDPATGSPLRLKVDPNRPAIVRIPVDPIQIGMPGTPAGPPESIALWFYNEATGLWDEEGTATLDDSGRFYTAEVRHFSTINVDIEKTTPQCIRIETVEPLKRDYDIELTIGPGPTATREVEDDVGHNAIINLPNSTSVTVNLVDTAGNDIPIATYTQSSGSNGTVTTGPDADYTGSEPNWPGYSECSQNVDDTIAISLQQPEFSNQKSYLQHYFEYYVNQIEAQTAIDYYLKIDPAVQSAISTAIAFDVDATGKVLTPTSVLSTFSGSIVPGHLIKIHPGDPINEKVTLIRERIDRSLHVDPPLSANEAVAANDWEIIGDKPNLAAFEAANGFDAASATGAIFRNTRELDAGRWVQYWDNNAAGGGPVFYISDYDSADLAAGSAVNTSATFPPRHTLAIEYTGTPRFAKFYAFDSNGDRVLAADMDTNGSKIIPTVCVTCHGTDKAGTPTGDMNGDLTSSLIPFDVNSYTFPDTIRNSVGPIEYPYARSEQLAAFDTLNQAISANANQGIIDVITGWYASGNDPDGTFVPTSWTDAGGTLQFYLQVIVPSCRSCHITQDIPVRFASWSYFDDPVKASLTYDLVCAISRNMPNAEATYRQFWLSASPHQPALMSNAVAAGSGGTGWGGACPP